MRKFNKSLSVLFIAAFSAASFAAYSQATLSPSIVDGGSKKIIPTQCVVRSTGEVVGLANNCGSGSGNCIDTTCN